MGTRQQRLGLSAAVVILGLLAGCSGNSSTGTPSTAGSTPAQSTASTPNTGPASLTFWGQTQGQQAQVDLWNSQHPDIKITYVYQSINDADETTAIQNAAKAGKTPDIFEMPRGTATSFLVDGVTQDVSQWFNNDDGAYSDSAYGWAKVGDAVVGVPFGTNPTFNAIHKTTFATFGLAAPADWTEALTQAKTMAAGDVMSFNFPGEDPSYLRDFASQAGAQWWSVDGDSWKVGFTSAESEAAGDLVQQIIDDKVFSSKSYTEWDALMQYFDSGQVSQFTTSTWQLPAYEQNFSKSIGDWKLAPYPKAIGASTLVSPSYFDAYGVAKTASNPAAAVQFLRWITTDPDAIKLMADTAKGSGTFPVVADPSPYIEMLLPSKLLGDDKSAAPAVIEQAVQTSAAMTDGPDQAAALEELADQWAQAITGKITV